MPNNEPNYPHSDFISLDHYSYLSLNKIVLLSILVCLVYFNINVKYSNISFFKLLQMTMNFEFG